MPFASEKELFNDVLNSSYINSMLDTKRSVIKFIEEPKGLFGIPDLVIATFYNDNNNNICRLKSYAFEMKLKNWKRALSQAFRYKAFVEYSYVILDENHINPALENIDLFKKSNIGLLGVSDKSEVFSYYKPRAEKPYCQFLRDSYKNIVHNYSISYQS